MSESEPRVDHDPFSDGLLTYMRDVEAMKADGLEDIGNNRLRLKYAFSDLLEHLNVSPEVAIEKAETLIPSASHEELGLSELLMQYKLAPLRLLDQRQPDCPLALEDLTVLRIEKIFDYALAGEGMDHLGCPEGDIETSLSCPQNLTCPVLLSRRIGKDLLGLLVVRRQLSDEIEPQFDQTLFNLLQLKRSLIVNQVMSPAEIGAYARVAEDYAFEELLGEKPRRTHANDDIDGN